MIFINGYISTILFFLASGLQLYIARDGTASLGGHEVKSSVRAGALKQVVMQDRR